MNDRDERERDATIGDSTSTSTSTSNSESASAAHASATTNEHAASSENLLALVPARALPSTRDETTGTVAVVVPKVRTRFGRAICRLLRQETTYALKLDAFGTAVWDAIDNESTVAEIGRALRATFGQEVEPLYPRLATFLRLLEREGVIQYRDEMK